MNLRKKGVLDILTDNFNTAIILLISLLFALFVAQIQAHNDFITYRTSTIEVNDEHALNIYLRYPIDKNTQVADIIADPENKEEILTITATNYFTNYFGEIQWWSLVIDYPIKDAIIIQSKAAKAGQHLIATATLPTSEGIATIKLYQDNNYDIALMVLKVKFPLLAGIVNIFY